jgi:hypothetical protein
MNTHKIAIGLLALLLSAPASAGFMRTGIIESDGVNATLDHTFFQVTNYGLVTINLTSTDNPEMNLWSSDADFNLGGFLLNDDDGGLGDSARINLYMSTGYYAIVSGEFAVDDSETGYIHANDEDLVNPYTMDVDGRGARFLAVREGVLEDGTYIETLAIPEPSILALFGLGLLGLGFAGRKVRS